MLLSNFIIFDSCRVILLSVRQTLRGVQLQPNSVFYFIRYFLKTGDFFGSFTSEGKLTRKYCHSGFEIIHLRKDFCKKISGEKSVDIVDQSFLKLHSSALALVTHWINSNFFRCICIRFLTMLIHITHTMDDHSIYLNNWWKRFYIFYYFQRNDFKRVNTTKQLKS